jgi:hypothetical protein
MIANDRCGVHGPGGFASMPSWSLWKMLHFSVSSMINSCFVVTWECPLLIAKGLLFLCKDTDNEKLIPIQFVDESTTI